MNKAILEKANILNRDIQKLDEIISDLEHINRKSESPYNPNKDKRLAGWKKLFPFTLFCIEKDRIKIDPDSIQSTKIDPFDFENEKVSFTIGEIRSEFISKLIDELKETKNGAKKELKKL